jgi:phage baseplate assembly protein W
MEEVNNSMVQKNIILQATNVKAQTTVKSSQFYKGFSSLDEGSITTKQYDFDVIKQDLLNQLNTRKGERLMNPTFGTIIWDLIYEPLTPDVKAKIAEDLDTILTNDPRLIPTNINVVEQQYGFYIELSVQYANTDKTDQMRLEFNRNAGLLA